MKKLLVAALFVVLASPAFAAIQNVKVSGDITTSWVDDSNFDLGAPAAIGDKSQNVFLTQTRLRVDADLSDNVSTEVGLINERAWNAENCTGSGPTNDNCDTNVQLYLATLTLKQFLYSPLTLEIGRQTFNFGNGLVMGGAGPANAAAANLAGIYSDLTERTAYDGVTATLDYKPLTISLIYFKNGQTLNSIEGLGHQESGDSSDVFGYNANYQLSDPWSTVVEQYMFAEVNGTGFDNTAVGAAGPSAAPGNNKGDTLYVPGLRASTNPTKSLNVQGEVAWQLGNIEVGPSDTGGAGYEGEHRSAMAAQLLATYTLPVFEKYKPSVNVGYTYASGDKNSGEDYEGSPVKSSRTYTAWNEFNTVQGAGTIYRSLFDLSNENILSAGASVAPLEDVTAGVTWSGLWAASPISAQNPLGIIQPDGANNGIISVYGPKDAYWLGNETDVSLTYNYTEDVTFGLNLGWFVPGDVFPTSNKETASQAIANVAVTF